MGFMRFVLDKRAMFIFMSAALFIAGVFSFRSLPIEPYPNVSPLIVQVITQWPGRGAAEVEQQLTVPIEIAMAGVAGVDAIRSVSLFGLSIVTIKFVEGSDSFRARQNVTQKIGDATLPNGVDPNLSPDADAVGEILRYRLEGDSIDLITLKSLQDWELTKQIKLVPGVADIPGFGGLVKQYLIQPLPGKLQLYGISVNQLVQALTNANANVGGGLLSSGQQQFVVRGVGLLKSPEEMKEVIVAAVNIVLCAVFTNCRNYQSLRQLPVRCVFLDLDFSLSLSRRSTEPWVGLVSIRCSGMSAAWEIIVSNFAIAELRFCRCLRSC